MLISVIYLSALETDDAGKGLSAMDYARNIRARITTRVVTCNAIERVRACASNIYYLSTLAIHYPRNPPEAHQMHDQHDLVIATD